MGDFFVVFVFCVKLFDISMWGCIVWIFSMWIWKKFLCENKVKMNRCIFVFKGFFLWFSIDDKNDRF